MNLSSGVVAIELGDRDSCALVSDGSVKCWGLNSLGQLGDGTINNRNIPVTMTNITRAAWISAGYRHTCVLVTPGRRQMRRRRLRPARQRDDVLLGVDRAVRREIRLDDEPRRLGNPSTSGQNVTFTAFVTGLDPGGGVSFAIKNQVNPLAEELITGCVSIPVVNGQAACTTNALSPGTTRDRPRITPATTASREVIRAPWPTA